MSAPAEQLHLPFQPQAAHALRISTHSVTESYASSPISGNIDLRQGMLPEGFDYGDLDTSEYFTPEDGKRLPVTDTWSILENYVDNIHSFRGINSLPHVSELDVQGPVLTEATHDQRFHNVAASIMSLTPAGQEESQISTELVIIGNEPVKRLRGIIIERAGQVPSHKPALVALRGLHYMKQYAQERQRITW